MSARHSRLIVNGWISGGLYWPAGQKSGKPFELVISLTDRPAQKKSDAYGAEQRLGLFDLVRDAINEQDGDFSTAGRLTVDSTVEVEHRFHGAIASRTIRSETRSRLYQVDELASIADLIDAETYSSDFLPDND